MVEIPTAATPAAAHRDPEAGRLMRRATYAAVGTASLLIVIKLVAWAMTGSLALLSTLVDSILDAAASVINLFAVRVALEPPDHDHRFGHGKAEPLAGLAQALFIGGSALFLVVEAIQRLAEPIPVERSAVGIVVMLASIGLTLALVAFQRQVVRRTRSVAIQADSTHYAGDVLVNASVIVALVLSAQLGVTWADPVFAIAIAGYLLYNTWGILRHSLNLLMDREFEETDRLRILQIARDHPKVLDAHDLRTRSSGPHRFIQVHIEMDRDLPLWHAHAVGDDVEARIRNAFPDADILIHQDPSGQPEPHDGLAYADGVVSLPEDGARSPSRADPGHGGAGESHSPFRS